MFLSFPEGVKIHYCPVLNFVQQKVEKGIDDEMTKKFDVESFDVDDILKAKKWLGSKLYPEANWIESVTEPSRRYSGLYQEW